ncbi:MAG: glycosyltransferase [Planctomycetes bacterium]|nr:glycosyltransferase [Planctomycetota bacterium]
MPRVSVCFTNYNYARWCGEAVASILAQPMGDLEVIVVENASTDGSIEVLRRIEAGDRRVRVVALEANVGASGGWQAGLECATGEYVCFLSTDDLWPDCFLEETVRLLDLRRDLPLAYGRVEVFGGDPAACAEHARVFTPGPLEGVAFLDRLLVRNFVPQGTTLLRREAVLRAGGFDPAIQVTMDYDLLLRVALQGPGGWIDRVLARYRWHGDNVSAPLGEAYLRTTADRLRSLTTLLTSHAGELEALGRIARVRAERRRSLEALGKAHYRRGEYPEARRHLGGLLAESPLRPGAAFRYLKSWLRPMVGA